ncbi:MAG: YciI family protein [Rhodothermales bacterium]
MKFLCLAYGKEDDWNELNSTLQNGLLAQDEILRQRGDVVAAVEEDAATVRVENGAPMLEEGSLADSNLPLTGFYIIEASNRDEAVHLIHDTPCAGAKGAIEVRAISEANV